MKKISVMLVLVLIVGIFAACGADTSDNEKKEPTYVMQLGHAQALGSPRHVSSESFKKAVEERTNGDVSVEIFPSGQLGDETMMTEAVSLGTLQAVRGGDQSYIPDTMMLSLPMLADNLDQVHKLCYSDFLTEMLSSTEEEYGIKVLAIGDDSGFRQITNNKNPIKTPADMKGIKMRTVLPVIEDSMKAFGASTVTVPFTELYMSLRTGVADGQENPLALIASEKFYEVQKYCTLLDYMFFIEPFYVNLEWFNSLPEEYQEILTEEARNMMDETTRICQEDNEKYLETIKKAGVEVYIPTDAERQEFRALSENVWKKWIDNKTMTREQLDKMLEVVGKSVDW